MKKTMFKKVFAGFAAMFMMCLCLPMCSMEFMPNAKRIAEAEDEWLDMCGIEYKIKDRDTLIINDNSFPHDYPIELNGFNFETYAADIKHLQIGKGWRINNFSYLTAIESLTIGDNCNIGEHAFWERTSLTSVTIGEGCDIEYEAFDDCTALESVIIGNDCTIGETAFWGCTSLTNVTMGNDCTIGKKAFWDCTSLTSVTIGDGCTIGEDTFDKCKSLTNVTIGDSCTVNTYAFWSCTSLTSVTMGSGCTIKFMAFSNCNSIQKVFCKGSKNTVTVDDNNPEIIRNKDKWTIITGTICPKCYCNAIDYKCESCGYFDEAFVDAEIARLNALKQKYGTNTTEPPTTTEEGNTASTFSNGSVLAIIGGSAFLILCGLAAVIIVKRRKKTE